MKPRKLSADEVAALGLDDSSPPTGRKLSPQEAAALGLDEEAQATQPKQSKPGQLKALGYGAARGASLGFVDRLVGLGTKIGDDWSEMLSGSERSPDAYNEGRTEYLQGEDEARDAHPWTHLGGQVAGGMLPTAALLPVSSAARAATAGGHATARVAGRLAQPALEGGLAGAGNTRDDDIGEMGRNAATGAAITGTVAGAGELARAGVAKVASTVKGGLRRRILNEIAEGERPTTPTERRKLEMASGPITREVVDGPDADAVRSAYQSGAVEGQKLLKPIIQKIGDANAEAYGAFEKAGRDAVSIPAYNRILQRSYQQAVDEGDSHLAKALRTMQQEVFDQANQATGGVMRLPQLRGLTTQAQSVAQSALGNLTPAESAVVKRKVAGIVKDAMYATVKKAAHDDPVLLQAAEEIGANNQRLYGLLSIDSALAKRGAQEATGRSPLVRGAERLATPVALLGGGGAVAGAFTGDGDFEESAKRAMVGLAVAAGGKALPAMARSADRGITSAAISAARGKMPLTVRGTQRGADAIAKLTAARLADRERDEELARKLKAGGRR